QMSKKEIKMKKYYQTCKHNFTLYNQFCNYENPELVILYIYTNIYELINEMKYIPHARSFVNFHDQYIAAYFDYYNKMIVNYSFKYLFPNPIYSYKFNFKNFFIGVVGRLFSSSKYCYGDPATWNIGYKLIK